jgi:hypothetical protein
MKVSRQLNQQIRKCYFYLEALCYVEIWKKGIQTDMEWNVLCKFTSI